MTACCVRWQRVHKTGADPDRGNGAPPWCSSPRSIRSLFVHRLDRARACTRRALRSGAPGDFLGSLVR
jgi:hypothetical protein